MPEYFDTNGRPTSKKPWAICGACRKNESNPKGTIFGFVCVVCENLILGEKRKISK